MGEASTAPAGGSVAIIGAGLSGLAAAYTLADLGHRVTLIEERPFAGGRACSFRDRESDIQIDNGQHVFMRCYERYVALLDRIGASDRVSLQPRLSVDVAAEGTWARVTAAGPRAPLHLLPSLAGYAHLSWLERGRLVRGAASAMLASRPTREAELDAVSFHDWLLSHGQTDRCIDRFWNLICLATLNLDAHRASASQALMVLHVGFLRSAHAADIGFNVVPLGEIANKAASYLRARGANLFLRERVSGLRVEGGQVVWAGLARGGRVEADRFVAAVPPDRFLRLLPREWADHPAYRPAAALGFSPIVNVHLWYDRPVMLGEMAASLGTRLQWIFNKGSMLGSPALAGRYLVATISGADTWLPAHEEAGRQGRRPLHVDDLPGVISEEVAGMFASARGARLPRARVILEPHATFVAGPGLAAARLPAAGPLANLWLAGDWTRTGWPATMEGAVRSGEAAAALVHASAGGAGYQ